MRKLEQKYSAEGTAVNLDEMNDLDRARAQLLQTLCNRHRAFPIVRRRFALPGEYGYVCKPLFSVMPITLPIFYQNWLEDQGKK